ncbi:hypothetical protein [Streptomyces katrae]|uniref:Uncharacterized protein n=1 Tax=Streptomyces katrae TaxID=68223 RepID=A0A0F4JP01_9ACTN|nr:hypothetical protein [Streptomyces katrae]KJY34666.1 hypothetical protein VR44_11520 [Streptomyces katrae]
MTQHPHRTATLQDLIASLGVLLVIPALVLRRAGRDGTHPDLVAGSWGLQGLALLAVLAGMSLALVRGSRPSPGMWVLLALWTAGTGTALLAPHW